MGWFRWMARGLFARWLRRGPVPLFARLTTSHHLGDYQFIGVVALALILLGALTLTPFLKALLEVLGDPTHPPTLVIVGGVFATVTTMATWVYQSANKRLGTVDLFACEIGSICRVGLVTNFAEKSILMHKEFGKEQTRTPTTIDVRESYTPVYDKGASDLQSLDTNSVTAITAFYTYRKTMMDYLRATLAAPTGALAQERQQQMIYMQFLMYENARIALQELAEFEPERAQHLVTIYCSELPLFTFLIRRYRGDRQSHFLYKRLRLRIADYDKNVQALLDRLKDIPRHSAGKDAPDSAWIKAQTTAAELEHRFLDFQLHTRKDKRDAVEDPNDIIWVQREATIKPAKHAARRGRANGQGTDRPQHGPPPSHPGGGLPQPRSPT